MRRSCNWSKFGTLLLISLSLLTGAICVAQSPSTTKMERAKVAALLPLTGETASIGQEMQRGMELAMRDGADRLIEVVYEDDQFTSQKAASALQKLLAVDEPLVLFSSVVNIARALAPIINQNKVPNLVLWDNNEFLNQLGPYVHGIGYPTEVTGQDMADYAAKKLKISRLGIIQSEDDWAEILTGAFKKRFEENGGSVLVYEKVPTSTTDLKSIIAKMKERNLQAIYFPLLPDSRIPFLKQVNGLGFKGYLLTGDLISDEIDFLREYQCVVYSTQVWVNDSNLEMKYKEVFQKDIPQSLLGFVALGYDGVKLVESVVSTLKRDGKEVNKQSIQAALNGFHFEGITGEITLGKGGTSQKRTPVIKFAGGKESIK